MRNYSYPETLLDPVARCDPEQRVGHHWRWLNRPSNSTYIAMGRTLLLLLLLLGFLGLRFKLVLRWLHWYFVGSVGISLVVIPSLNVDEK